MRNIYISCSFKHKEDLFAFNLKRDLIEMGYEVVNNENNESFFDDSKSTPEYWISRADVFIAILKDKNPFVFYELGYATALGKKVLIISESEYDLPFSLKNYNYIRYDSGTSNSIYNVINFLQKTTVEDKSLPSNISTFKDLILNIQQNPQVIDRVSGPEFEKFILNYFQQIGATIRPISAAEYGYDFMLYGWEGCDRTLIEVKKYNKNSKVSVNTIQQVVGAMNIGAADRAIIISTSEFTTSAIHFAASMKKPIELWDINFLVKKVLNS